MPVLNQPIRALPETQQDHWYNAPQYRADDAWFGVVPERTAVVLIDLIDWQVAPDGPSIQSIRQHSAKRADYIVERCERVVLPNVARLVAAARNTKIQIVHARLASRHPAFCDIVPALRPFVRAADARDGSPACAPIPEVCATAADLSIVKTGSGAFAGSDLDFILKRLGIDTLIYAGVVTNACVMLSVASGFDLGYRQYLATDCTGALCDEDQADAERLMGFYLAQLVTTDDTITALDRLRTAPRSPGE
ncbi:MULTISPECIES: cysteine hydrolase [unclassified Sphingomonas]|uniref:cysteine hydrolase family protein n=1 Tax=unclassified Sphingomonas TaxID=196159 RepID=UPI00092BD36D|nr:MULTISPECIES: cysteine hydrolase [unclassified Sphingomonas]MBN8848658.1 cysteine hydrolase [Sphingomonas sp.]OJV34757.1 MAG: hypothetical protein BGO24_01360 [Sphingomonas sp. 67-36]